MTAERGVLTRDTHLEHLHLEYLEPRIARATLTQRRGLRGGRAVVSRDTRVAGGDRGTYVALENEQGSNLFPTFLLFRTTTAGVSCLFARLSRLRHLPWDGISPGPLHSMRMRKQLFLC